jgi:hypothetical protein
MMPALFKLGNPSADSPVGFEEGCGDGDDAGEERNGGGGVGEGVRGGGDDQVKV